MRAAGNRGAAALVLAVAALAGCTPAVDPDPPEGGVPEWREEQIEQTEALTSEWEGREALGPPAAVTSGLALSEPLVPPASAEDGSSAHLLVGGGSVEEPAGSGRYYLVLPMVSDRLDPDGEVLGTQECSGRAFAGQVAECDGWVVRALSVAADGGGTFEVLAAPDGFEPPGS